MPAKLFLLIALALPLCFAQPSRIVKPIDPARTIALKADLRPEATPKNDLGPAPSDLAIDGITIHFKKSPAQQAELDTLLAEQQRPGSPSFHRWLTPDQYADRFGISKADLARVSTWLQTAGFKIGYTARGRSHIVFAGTAAGITATLHTPIHRYRVNGTVHFANSAEPSIPASLADVVESIEGLHDFLPESDVRARPVAEYNSGSSHYLAPDDLALIYNVTPLLNAGIDGTGQSLAIVGQSNIDPNDLTLFRTKFNLSPQNVQVMLVPGQRDPGFNSAQGEADLDLQWSGAIARNATTYYVYATSAYVALQYVVDQSLAPVVSASFSASCEAKNISQITTYRNIAQKAAVEGITWLNSSGDAGAAGCDANGAPTALSGLAARFPASVPEITAVGGTQFNEGSGTYWATSNSPTLSSALGYIPEKVWNESNGVLVLGGGGGVSFLYAKPSWQTGTGVPDDGFRDLPDVSLASAGHDGYYAYSTGKAFIFSGTSAASPVFAGMMVLLNQYVTANGIQSQPGLGNINPALYRLAQSAPSSFHDIVTGDNAVPCSPDSPNCVNGVVGYPATPGYDLATGLGSVDLNALIHNWDAKPAAQTIIGISTDNLPVYSSSGAWTYTITLSEQGGLASTITDFSIDGVSQASKIASLFGSTTLAALGKLSSKFTDRNLAAPVTRTFEFSGTDANGAKWSQAIKIPFLNLPTAPLITAAANAASYDLNAAPGMILAIFGTNLAAAPEQAAFVPLTTWMNGTYAVVNGVSAPLYYISPSQVNVQVPYSIQPGKATLQVVTNNGLVFNSFGLNVVAANPGIFADANGYTVPYSSGSRGQTYTLFITGEGQVIPSLATGSAPSLSTPVANLPKPVLPVSVTLGGKDCTVLFAGIPYNLVGVTQINFTVPADAPTGVQDVIVTVGTAPSKPAKFTVNNP